MTSKRIDKVRQEISLKNLDGIYVNNITNVRYLTGFSGSAGSLLILENDSHFFTDGRYTEQVKEQVKNSTIHIVGGTHIEGVDKNNLLKSGMKIGFESDHTTVTSFNALQNKLSQISWQPTSNIVELIAAVKDREEIESLKTAIEITDIVFDEILSIFNKTSQVNPTPQIYTTGAVYKSGGTPGEGLGRGRIINR